MNKIYKVIWNATLSAWVAVSELAKGKTKSSKVTGIVGAATVSLMVAFSPEAMANTIDMQAQGNKNDADCVSGGNTTVYKAQTNGTTGAITDGSGTYSTVAGCNASGGGVLGATAYGSYAKVTGKGGTALGHNTEAAQWALAAGVDTKATGESSVALGSGAVASNTSSIAIGTDSGTSGIGAIAIGRNAQTSASGSIAIGDGATATGGTTDINSIAIGKGAQSWGQSFALGTGASADSFTFDINDSGVAVGAQSVTAAGTTKGTAIGVNAKVTGSTVAGTAIGSNAVASIDNSVALGSNSITSAITGTGFLTSQAAPTVGAVSVGNGTAAGNRRIQNVADGSAASDAVTVAQLDKAYDDTNGRLAGALGAGSGAVYNAATNAYTAPTNIGGTGKTTIDEAIKATQRSVTGGSNIVVTPTTAADGSISYSVATSATPTFTTVTTGNSKLDNTGLTITGGPSVTSSGINAANTTINNVANATTADQAVNKGQLDTVSTQANKAITFTGNARKSGDTTDINRKLGDSIAISGTATTAGTYSGANVKTVTDQSGAIAIQIADAPNFAGTVTSTGLQVNGASAVTGNSTIGGTQTVTGISNLNGGANLNSKQITGLASGGTTLTNAANIGDVTSAAAAAKTVVQQGKNTTVSKTVDATNKNDIYTVDADSSSVTSTAGALTVTKGTKDANNNTAYDVDLSTATKTDIAKGVAAKAAVDNTGLTFKGDTAATSTAKKLGDTVSITGDTNISTVATANGVQVKLNPNLDLGAAGSVKTGNTTINNAGVTADQVTVGGVVINNTTGINAGGKAITNVAAPTNNTDAANKKYVDDAGSTLTNLGFGLKAQDGTTVNKKLGEAVDIVGSNSNITTKVNAGKVEVALSNALDLGAAGSVTTGATVINNAGITANKVTVNNAPTAGTDATNKTYVDSKAAASKTEVAGGSNIAGVAKTTGANGQDVYTVNANGTTASAGSSAVTVTAGTKDANNVTDYKVDLATSTKTDIQKGVDAKTAVDNTGLTFKGDTAATSTTKKLGDTVSITGDTNISTVATANGVQVKLNPNLDLGAAGSVKTGNTTINNAGVTADQVTVGGVVINNTTGINAGGKAITNVAAPTNNTDAANKKYVDDAGSTLTNLGFGLKAQDGTTVNKKLGEAVDIVGSNSNITTKVNAGKVEVALSNALDLGAAGSVTTGATVINNAGITANKVTVNNAPTAGTDATNKTYVDSKAAASKTEVAGGSNIAGVAKTTGANGQDVYTVNANGTTASAGSSAVTVTAGTKDANNVTDYKVDLATSTKTDIQKGADAKTAVDNTGLTFKGDTAATSTTKKLGDTVSITGDTNISTVATANGVQVKLNPNLDLGAAGSVKTGNTTINNAGVTADQVTVGGVVINNTTGINAGGKAITNVAAPTNNTDAANKKYVDDAGSTLTNLGFGLKAQDGTTVNKKLGEAVDIVGSNSNITTKVNAGKVEVALSNALDLGAAGSVTTGATVINNAGITANKVTVNNAPTAGTDATNKTYVDSKSAASKTEVAGGSNIAGVAKTTGANGQDIYTVNANGTTASAGSSAVTVTAGTKDANNVTDYKVDLAAATKTDIAKGVAAKAAVDNTGLTFKGDTAATSTTKKLGDTVSITGDTNISTVATTDGVQVKLNPNLDLGTAGSVTTGNSKLDNSGLTITGGPSVTSAGINAGGKAITNVAAPTNNTDAANKKYVDDAGATLTNLGFGLKAQDGTTVNKKLGEAVEVVGADSNITTKVANGQVAIELNKNLNNLTGITVNDGTNGTNGSTVIGKDGISVKDGSGNTIAGVDNTALTVKDGSGNTETSINKAINTLNASQGETDKFAVKYDKNADGSANYNNITLAGSASSSTKDATTGKITTTGGTSLNNVASAGDYTKEANASKGVNAGDLNNAVVDATNAATSKGFALQAADGAKVQKNLGEAVEVVGADSNITTKVANGQVAIELNKNLNNLTGITVNDGTNGTNGSTVIGKDGISVKDGSGNTIAGLDNTALTVKDGSGNTETSINKAINTLNASQGETDKFAVKYDKNADGSANYNNITLAGSASSSTKDATTGKITTTGGTSLNNVASAGDYTKEANASKGVNAGDLNNAVVDATNAATSKGFALQAADGAKVQKNLGEAVEVVGADSNITTKVANGQVAIELNKNLNNLTGITVNDGTNGTNGSTVIGKDGISVKDGSGNTIAGVDNTALTVKDGSGNTETSINKAINTLNASQGETDKFAVKYDKNADGSANYNNITLAGSASSSTKDATTGKITTTGGTSLNNVASAGDYTKEANASKGVNAGDLNNAVVDATNAATSKGFALQAADGAKVQKNLGEAVEVVGADSNITTKVANGQVAIELNKNLNNLTGITVNDGTNGTNGSTVIGKDGISVKDGSGNTIAGLDNTALTVKDGSGNTETSINKAINTLNASQGETDKFAVKYDKNADGSANYDNVTLAGTGGTTITNVKAGAINATSTDAINGSQLYDVGNSLKNAIGGLTTRDATTGIITTSNIGGTGSNTIDGAINSIKDSATKAKTTVTAGDNVVVTAGTNADGSSNYQVATAKDVNFDKVTVGNVVVNKASNTIEGLSNTDLRASDFATKGRAATEEQLKQAVTKNITEVVDGNGNKVNIIDQVVNTKPDNKNQDSLFLTYDKQGQETTDRLTIGQTVQKMNTDGIKFFHTNADMSKGDLGTTNDSSAGGLNSTAIGVNAIVATGADSAVALGHNTKAEGKQSIAIGQGAEALGTQSISIGTGNKVKGNHSGAIGDPTIVDGANSYSVGNNNQVLTDDTFVLGNNVTKTVAGSVVLGNGSAATTSAGVAGYALSAATSADKTAISNTTSTTGAVAVGDAASGIYRQITGVAAGSADADAVNVAQLKAVGNQVVTTQNALVNGLGGNAKVNADGTITGPTYNVAQGNQSNVGDALTALDKAIGSAATTSKTTVSNGQNIVVNKSKNADGSDNYEVSTAKDLTVDSVKAGDTVLNNAGISIGNNAVVINNTGLTIAGGPSVTVAGINAGNKTITNVANAVNATDAVNKGQLDSAIGTVNNNVNELANNAVKYDDASKDKITLGGGANGTTISNVKDGAVSQGSKDAVNGGQLWNVQQQVDQNSTDISNIKNDINNGSVGLVQQAGKDATVTVAKDTGGTSVSVAGKDGNRVVTGVKDGAVNATSKDAVNGSQLNTTNQAVVNYLGGGAGYDNITGSFTAPTYNVGDSKYNNVGGAIDALNQADQALNSKIDNVSNKLDNAFRITNNRIDDVEKKANAGIAAAMALESAPYIPGKYTYAAGAAYHGGENAVGVTLRKTADNGRWSITGGVAAASQGDPSVRIGISGVID